MWSRLFAAGLLLVWMLLQSCSSGEAKDCTTSDCKKLADHVIKQMDQTVLPCKDFYGYVCGNYPNIQSIAPDMGIVSIWYTYNRQLRAVMKKLLEKAPSKNDWPTDKLVKSYYQSCVDETTLDNKGLQPMKKLLNDAGNWPVVKGDAPIGFSHWTEIVHKFASLKLNVDFIFSHRIKADAQSSQRINVVHLDQPSLGLERKVLLGGLTSADVRHHFKYMVDTAVLFGAKRVPAENDMRRVLKLMIDLAKISASKEDRADPLKTYTATTVGQFNWQASKGGSVKQYLNTLYSNMGAKSVVLTDSDKLIIGDVNYFRDVFAVLERTSVRTITNYVMWRQVQSKIRFLNKQARDIEVAYNKARNLAKKPPQKWHDCLRRASLSSRMDVALSSLFARDEDLTTKRIPFQRDILPQLKEAFRRMLTNSKWMDTETIKAALKKLDGMEFAIAFPDQVLEKRNVTEYYSGLKFLPSEYLSNDLALEHAEILRSAKKFRRSQPRYDWPKYARAFLANTQNHLTDNVVALYGGMLGIPMFSPEVPMAYNFAFTGALLAVSMTNAYSNEGKGYNERGQLKNWWSAASEKEFEKRSQCLVDQFDKFYVEQVQLYMNGKLTLPINIGENGASKAVYDAFKTWLQTAGPQKTLPGLSHLTPEKLFWIVRGQMSCQQMRDGKLRFAIKNWRWPMGKFRLRGLIQNSPEFSKVFGCSVGDPMNPKKKCELF